MFLGGISQLVTFWKMNVTFPFTLLRKGLGRFSCSPDKCFHCISCDIDRVFWELGFPLLWPIWQPSCTDTFSGSPGKQSAQKKPMKKINRNTTTTKTSCHSEPRTIQGFRKDDVRQCESPEFVPNCSR